MFKILIKNKKAQQTAEYALLISLVVAAVIAMQTYAQRTIQARIRDAATYFVDNTSGIGTTNQYEPYYLQTSYDVFRNDATFDIQGQKNVGGVVGGVFRMEEDSTSTRGSGGFQVDRYDSARGLVNAI